MLLASMDRTDLLILAQNRVQGKRAIDQALELVSGSADSWGNRTLLVN